MIKIKASLSHQDREEDQDHVHYDHYLVQHQVLHTESKTRHYTPSPKPGSPHRILDQVVHTESKTR